MGRKRSEPNEQPEQVEGAAEETGAEEAPPEAATTDQAPEGVEAAVDETQPQAEVAEEPAAVEDTPEPVDAGTSEDAEAAPDTESSEAQDEAVAESPAEEPEAKPARKAPVRKAPKPKAEKKPKPRRAPRTGERKAIVRLPRPERPRGKQKERQGIVVSSSMDKTIVVRVDSSRPDRTYKKVVRRSRKFHAHDERNEAGVGDLVRIVETRPLSKTKSWRLAEIVQAAK